MSLNFGCSGLIAAVAEVVVVQSQQNTNMMVQFQAHFEQLPHSLNLFVRFRLDLGFCFCTRQSISFDKVTLFQLASVSFLFSVYYRELSIDHHCGIDKDGVYQ